MPAARAIERDAAQERQPVLVVRARRREERAVPDEKSRRRCVTTGGEPVGDLIPCSSRKSICRGAPFFAAWARPMALPFLDAMVPAQTLLAKTAAAREPRLACIEMVHGSAGSTQEGIEKHYWMPEKEGADFDFTMILKPLEPYPRLHHRRHANRPQGRRSVDRGRRRRRPLPLERRVPDGGASEADRRVGRPRRHVDRSALCAAVRPRHAAAVPAARHRERGRRRHLRFQLRVRLLRTDQLVVADDAACR